MSESKIRLDQLLVKRGIVKSREKAKSLIMAGAVFVDGRLVDKPGIKLRESVTIFLKEGLFPKYVSRGGIKLEAALKEFQIDITDKVFLDVGASTGGFTDCLLQHGAKRVIAIDVGYGQLHWKLRNDPRVRILEKTNIRYLTPERLGEKADGAVIDVSFISLKLVIPPVSNLLKERAMIIALIKPQFEVGKKEVGKGGVVRDPRLHEKVIKEITNFSRTLGWKEKDLIPSPILGPKGNKEFLLYLIR